MWWLGFKPDTGTMLRKLGVDMDALVGHQPYREGLRREHRLSWGRSVEERITGS